MFAHEVLELRDELRVSAESEICVHPELECSEAKLCEAQDLRLREGRVR